MCETSVRVVRLDPGRRSGRSKESIVLEFEDEVMHLTRTSHLGIATETSGL